MPPIQETYANYLGPRKSLLHCFTSKQDSCLPRAYYCKKKMICRLWLEFVCNEKRDSHGLHQFLTEIWHMSTCPSSPNTTNYLPLINTANIWWSHIAVTENTQNSHQEHRHELWLLNTDQHIIILPDPNISSLYEWRIKTQEQPFNIRVKKNLQNGTDVLLYTNWLQLKQYFYSLYSTRKMYNTDFPVEVLAYSSS